jgi:transcriptional regulator with XRE-family HTH domain
MTNVKEKAKQLIEAEKQRLGSYSAVAEKCGVSEATLSLILSNKYRTDSEDIFDKIINEIVGVGASDWHTVPIGNLNRMFKFADVAKAKSMFVAVSEKAGSGKSAAWNAYYEKSTGGVYKLRCREWGKREFLRGLCKATGAAIPKGYTSNDAVSEIIFEFFARRSRQKPLLIIDEADKLKPSALRFLIPLYNELEDRLGVIVSGTENLEKEIKRGVNYASKGYDEIDSRFGRNFIHLIGATLADVRKICAANGIENKETQTAIFNECGAVLKDVDNQDIKVVEDLRRLKRIIQRHQLQNQ